MQTRRPGSPSSSLAATKTRFPSFSSSSDEIHCLSKKKTRQKPCHAYRQMPTILPTTLPIPIVYDMPPCKVTTTQEPTNKGLATTLRLIVRFASSSLGKNIKAKKTKKKKKKEAIPPPPVVQPCLARAHARQRNIKESSQVRLRHTFQVAATQGRLKTPVIHVEFNGPSNVKECLLCSSSDFLYVLVGLCNVFVLQFVMVVLLFFSQKEVNLSDWMAN